MLKGKNLLDYTNLFSPNEINFLLNNKVLISKVLIDSYISHDEFVLINNVLKDYNNMKKINNLKTSPVN